jgi:tetratricopeptide (TPR) repeat protein
LALIKLEGNELGNALGYIEKAVRYAEPYSKEWTSLSLSIKSRVHFLEGSYEMALRSAKDAVEVVPDAAQGYYELARAKAKLGQGEEAIKSLVVAIRNNPEYFEKSSDEEAFTEIADDVEAAKQWLEERTQTDFNDFVQESKKLLSYMAKVKREDSLVTGLDKELEASLSAMPGDLKGMAFPVQTIYRVGVEGVYKTTREQYLDKLKARIDGIHPIYKTFEIVDLVSMVGGVVFILAWVVFLLRGCNAYGDGDVGFIWGMVFGPIAYALLLWGVILAVLYSVEFVVNFNREQSAKMQAERKRKALNQLLQEIV